MVNKPKNKEKKAVIYIASIQKARAESDTPIIAQVLPVVKLVNDDSLYCLGFSRYLALSFLANIIAIIPQESPITP